MCNAEPKDRGNNVNRRTHRAISLNMEKHTITKIIITKKSFRKLKKEAKPTRTCRKDKWMYINLQSKTYVGFSEQRENKTQSTRVSTALSQTTLAKMKDYTPLGL